MKKVLLFLVICIISCFCLVGCGGKNNSNENQNVNLKSDEILNENVEMTNNVEESVTNNELNEMVENGNDNSFAYDDEIIEFDDIPNQAPEEDVIVTKVDESAEGLVFAYYQKKDAQLSFGDVLTNYTTDYKTIRTGSGRQRCAFLGFKLDENDRIQRAYACVIYKGVLYALEGTTDGSKYDSNKAIMNRMYELGEIEDKGYRYSAMNGDTHADVWNNGRASTFHEAGAQIDSHGKIYCD